jgi:DinB superfamily
MSIKPAPLSEPFTKSEILRDLGAVHDWSTEFWQSFDHTDFFAPLGDAWSPADNVRHLIKSNRPVAQALKIPKLFLLLRFGFARRPSRSYSALKATYYEALGSGLKAGRFGTSLIPTDQQTDERREQELAKLSQTFSALSAAIQGWSEGALDRLRLPHPGLGLLTVREMLLFTLYHNAHHVLGVDRRRRV